MLSIDGINFCHSEKSIRKVYLKLEAGQIYCILSNKLVNARNFKWKSLQNMALFF